MGESPGLGPADSWGDRWVPVIAIDGDDEAMLSRRRRQGNNSHADKRLDCFRGSLCDVVGVAHVTFDVPAVGHACIVIRKYRRAVVEVVTCAVRCVLIPVGHRTNTVSGTSGDMHVCRLLGRSERHSDEGVRRVYLRGIGDQLATKRCAVRRVGHRLNAFRECLSRDRATTLRKGKRAQRVPSGFRPQM